MRDLKYAFRTLRTTPFVNAVAILSLALGIGANAAIYSLFDQILLRPLPVAAPDELVNLKLPGPSRGTTRATSRGAATGSSGATRCSVTSSARRPCSPASRDTGSSAQHRAR